MMKKEFSHNSYNYNQSKCRSSDVSQKEFRNKIINIILLIFLENTSQKIFFLSLFNLGINLFIITIRS